jgi:hypothetical protein
MDEEGAKLFGKDGLIFDHTNPLDYLGFVPGVGVLGIGSKVLSTLNKTRRLKNLPRTQFHGGHSSVEEGIAGTRGIYSSPDPAYARAFKDRSAKDIEEFGPVGVYKLDLSSAKNIELLDKPSKQLKKAIDKQLKKNKNEEDRELNQNLDFLFKTQKTVEGSTPLLAGQKTRDWLRNQGVDILSQSKTVKKGQQAKSTDSEYYLLKDFPKKKLSDSEIKEVILSSRGFARGGEVSNNLQNFLSVASEAISLERSTTPTEVSTDYREGGRIRLI